jgi:hypothetical protein
MTSFSRKKLRRDTDWTITKLKIMNIHYLEMRRKSELFVSSGCRTGHTIQPCFTETVYDTQDIHCKSSDCLVEYNNVCFRKEIKLLNIMHREPGFIHCYRL